MRFLHKWLPCKLGEPTFTARHIVENMAYFKKISASTDIFFTLLRTFLFTQSFCTLHLTASLLLSPFLYVLWLSSLFFPRHKVANISKGKQICPISGTCHDSQSDNNVFLFSNLKCSGTCRNCPPQKWLHMPFSGKIETGFLYSSWMLWVLKQASAATVSLYLPLSSFFLLWNFVIQPFSLCLFLQSLSSFLSRLHKMKH